MLSLPLPFLDFAYAKREIIEETPLLKSETTENANYNSMSSSTSLSDTVQENSNSAPIATISKSGKIEHSKTPWPSIYIAGVCAFIQAAQFSIFFSSMWPYLRKLNPQIVETQYGYIVAMYSLGQCISAPTFGYWSNRIEQVRTPLLTGFVMMMIGNSIYFSLQFFDPSIVAVVMMIARFTTGSGTGNMALLRAYASTSSLKSDRSRAIACVSGGVATGTLIGPAFQLLFTPLGSDGITILPFYQLNIYNAPALFALLLNMLGFMLIMYAFEESYDVLHSEAAKETAGLPSPCMIAVLVCVITRFVQVFSATTIETLGSPFSMLMFSFNKEEAVAANSAAHLAAGVVGVILYVVFIFFDLSKWVPPRISTICSISIYGGLFLFTLPWPFLPGHVEPAANGSDFGCYTERFSWCDGLTGVSKWVYYPFYVSVFGVAASVLNIAVTTLYSEIIGPRRQGTFQGVFQMASSNGRLFAPLITSMLYTKYGPVAPWSLVIILVCIIVVLWTVFRRKMVPLKTKASANGCSP